MVFIERLVEQGRVVEYQPGHGLSGIGDGDAAVIVQHLDGEGIKPCGQVAVLPYQLCGSPFDIKIAGVEIAPKIAACQGERDVTIQVDRWWCVGCFCLQADVLAFDGDPELDRVLQAASLVEDECGLQAIGRQVGVTGKVERIGRQQLYDGAHRKILGDGDIGTGQGEQQ